MSRRVATMAILVVLLVGGLLSPAAAAGYVLPLPLPARMAAVGDSISQAASTGGGLGTDYPQNSWTTGTNATVNSHYLRLQALGAPISGQNYNLAVSGSKVIDLNAQMANVVGLNPRPDYLTVQIGGNDLCTDTFASMTSVSDFRARFQTAMQTLKDGAPNTNVYVVSIPDAYQLWSLFKGDGWARFIWSIGGVCQSLLANPTSTQAVDIQRRADVRTRNIAYNAELKSVCESTAFVAHCRFDNNAVFNVQFAKSDVAADYFHPSIAGQAKLASSTWSAGYTWSSVPPPPPPSNVAPTASFTSSCSDLACSFTDASGDSDGTIASRSWTFGDGAVSTDTNPSHTYAAGGIYTVSLIVTDNVGATGSFNSPVTVTAPPAAEAMWVNDLSYVRTSTSRNWQAIVTVAVVDQNGPVEGVLVTGTWSKGTGGTSCTTNASGTCAVTSSSLSKKSVPNVTYAVTGLSKAGWTYAAGSDVETFINVPKP